jgi:hypothetical protein
MEIAPPPARRAGAQRSFFSRQRASRVGEAGQRLCCSKLGGLRLWREGRFAPKHTPDDEKADTGATFGPQYQFPRAGRVEFSAPPCSPRA